MIELSYAQLEESYEEFNIPRIKFKTLEGVIEFIKEVQNYDNKNIVYIFGSCIYNEINNELFIHHNVEPFINHLRNHKLRNKEYFFLQEYESYETAYKVALDMRESHELCYDKN